MKYAFEKYNVKIPRRTIIEPRQRIYRGKTSTNEEKILLYNRKMWK
jgi:hypothetical protein